MLVLNVVQDSHPFLFQQNRITITCCRTPLQIIWNWLNSATQCFLAQFFYQVFGQVPYVTLMFDITVVFFSVVLVIDNLLVATVLKVTSLSSRLFKHLTKPSFSIAFDELISVTWTKLNSATLPFFLSMHVYVPFFALWPGLSDLPSPLSFSISLLHNSLTTASLSFSHATFTIENRY